MLGFCGQEERSLVKELLFIYRKLLNFFGEQRWWPADTPFEVIVGAVLTQNTNWRNVERAIENLKRAGVLTPQRLINVEKPKLTKLIRPAGYYNVKAKRLINFVDFLNREYRGDLEIMFNESLPALRKKILKVKGVGLETADSVLLYAGGKPIFVIDAYTKRVLFRHGIITDGATYQDIQDLFMHTLPQDISLYKEYHALLVKLAKTFCKPKPRCTGCPLEEGWPIS
ncbi:MAG: endonuclease III domain-containing protein [Deltaproteobacteria bacterium]|nr:MAG: endonuclease III domain-containing protein [Deltaproteobacteria bacterium]